MIEPKINEHKAASQSRIKIIQTSGEQIASQISVKPEYAEAASHIYSRRIIREQLNIDKIGRIAADQLRLEPYVADTLDADPEKEVPNVDVDWLNTFEKEAGQKSTEEMQLLFGKILAGQIKKPGSFSIKALKTISELEPSIAKSFKILCSLAVSLNVVGGSTADVRVPANNSAGDNELRAYGLPFSTLNALAEYNLISGNFDTYAHYGHAIDRHQGMIYLGFQGEKYILVPDGSDADTTESTVISVTPVGAKISTTINKQVKLRGVLFSQVGRELLSIVDIEKNEAYKNYLTKYIKSFGFNLTKIDSKQ
ncbi:DUF2806 domain-containing protein [Pseudomonas sp. Pseusp122]|uniref:DUF2806 domain-containing protein n=1 Tax=unclassified Pseudomonas TaxID=196821 RepID=UPI0039A553C1